LEAGIELKGSLTISVNTTINGVCKVNNANDTMKFDYQSLWDITPNIKGDGDIEVSAGTLTFDECTLDKDNITTWTLTGGTSTIRVTSDCDCGGASYDYTACDIDVQGGTLEVDNTFKTNGDVDLSGGMLQVDEQFTGKGELNFSGGTIRVAAGKIAAFTPND